MRKGDVIIGASRVIEAIQKGHSLYVFMASETGKNTQKKIRDKTKTYTLPLDESFSGDALSKAVGQTNIKVIATPPSALMESIEPKQ